MLSLDINSRIEYVSSSHRHFFQGERYITRTYNKSVLLLVYDSTLRFGEDGVQIEVGKGEYYIQRAGLAQNGLIPSDAAKYYYVHFHGDFTEGDGLPLRGRWDCEKILPLLEGMEGGVENGRHLLQKSLAFYSVLAELYSEARPKADLPAAKIMEYIQAHYRERLTISDLAARFYMSDNYLILLFRRQYGITPYKYITRLRLEKSRELLKNTTRSEEEIAFSLGFSDFSVFYKAFCAKYGYPPSSVRK